METEENEQYIVAASLDWHDPNPSLIGIYPTKKDAMWGALDCYFYHISSLDRGGFSKELVDALKTSKETGDPTAACEAMTKEDVLFDVKVTIHPLSNVPKMHCSHGRTEPFDYSSWKRPVGRKGYLI